LTEETFALPHHADLQYFIELLVELRIRRRVVDVPQLQPLADEVLHERFALRVLQQSFDLPVQDFWFAQAPLRREIHEFLVGHRAPEEIGKPRGEFHIADARCLGPRFLSEENKIRRAEYRD
jgi:hypothetical protein